MITRLAAAAAAAFLVAACGADEAGRYDAHVGEVREAVEAGDRQGALASLEEISTSALDAHRGGEVSDEELYELASLIELARAQVDEALPEAATTPEATTSTAPTTTTAPVPIPGSAGDDEDDDDEKKNKGKGKGRGGDDGDDD